MDAPYTKHSFDLSVNPLTVLAIFVGLVLAYFVYEIIIWAKNTFGSFKNKVSSAADQASTQYGFQTSQGQNDPALAYQKARQAYSIAQGYTPGTAEFLTPPGFPDEDTWLAQNPNFAPAKSASWLSDFKSALGI